jgi:hypothetical protein
LAVLGTVTKVAPVKKSDTPGSPFYSAAVELTHDPRCAGGRDGTFYLCLIPGFFTADFNIDGFSGAQEGSDASKVYVVYRNHIEKAGRTIKRGPNAGKEIPGDAALQVLAGEDFLKLVEVAKGFTQANPPGLELLSQVLAKLLTGKKVGYVLKQDAEDGELLDRYKVSYFFPATQDGIESQTLSASSKKRQTQLVLTWERELVNAGR